MGKRKREHKLAVIAGKEKPFRNPLKDEKDEEKAKIFALREPKGK